jgi:uncharacterized oxidoreductase
MKLEHKRILITGGGSGIGLELARRLAHANDVVIAGPTTTKLQCARAANPKLRPVELDVTSERSAAEVIDWLESDFGGLDLLVNNAGVMNGGDLTAPDSGTTSAEELAVNLGGAVRMTRLALPLLQVAPEAGILFVSSAVALTAVPHLSVYAASKAGVHSFARSLRAELADTTIRVFEALPPVVDTELAHDLDAAKITPAAVADAVIAGVTRDKLQIPIAQVRPLVFLARLAPRVADRIVQHAMQPTTPSERSATEQSP